jgi:hypothetical protein
MPGKSAGRALSLSLHSGIRLTTEEKSMRKTSVSLVEKCQLDTIIYVYMATF